MTMANPIDVVLKLEQAINTHDPDAICSQMTADGEFIDSLGNRIQGTENLRAAWAGYFKMVPDYSISHSEIFADGNTVAIFGSAQGTYVKNETRNEGEAGSRAEPAAQSARTTGDKSTRERVGAERQNFWKTPASWRVVVRDGKVALWQVYADNEPIRAIMRSESRLLGNEPHIDESFHLVARPRLFSLGKNRAFYNIKRGLAKGCT